MKTRTIPFNYNDGDEVYICIYYHGNISSNRVERNLKPTKAKLFIVDVVKNDVVEYKNVYVNIKNKKMNCGIIFNPNSEQRH